MKLKRDKLRAKFGEVEVYNPDPKQREEIANDIIELNMALTTKFQTKIKMLTDGSNEVTEEMISSLSKTLIREDNSDSDRLIRKYLKMLTNIPNELIDDDKIYYDFATDPSEEVSEAMGEINSILAKYVEKYQKVFNEQFKNSQKK